MYPPHIHIQRSSPANPRTIIRVSPPFAIDQRIRPAESIVRSVPVSSATGEQHLPLRAYSGTVFEIRLPFPLRAPIRQSPLEDAQGYIKSTHVSNHCSPYQYIPKLRRTETSPSKLKPQSISNNAPGENRRDQRPSVAHPAARAGRRRPIRHVAGLQSPP